ncbi:hypothetical protein EZJ49_06485 [Bdellovibrio bacteriovorus]|uniref:hypothetical protein n=1 Tax=Bdellovibrio bacteriovorus TaxID=959 RepID=UPI0021D1248C|nr:hypothetical protein [Bdellovibrio bacteriovorus]UXR65894.1 hypothetical protein EZJ49_06485 [Bdellovibrio bacteriovorus]
MLSKILIATLVTVSSMAYSVGAYAKVEEHIMPASDDRWVPWPFHLAQPFPWQDIQGIWKVEQGDYVSYFALKVVRQKSTGVRQLQVKQFDGETCKVLATGVGHENHLKVLAQMTSKGGAIYRVQMTAISQKDSPVPPLQGMPMDEVMVLSIGTLERGGMDEMVHMQTMKISATLSQRICIEDIKK